MGLPHRTLNDRVSNGEANLSPEPRLKRIAAVETLSTSASCLLALSVSVPLKEPLHA
jgi:hypothetical protein